MQWLGLVWSVQCLGLVWLVQWLGLVWLVYTYEIGAITNKQMMQM